MPDRREHFEVVMIRSGVSEFAAKPEDFSRVQVEALDSISARWDAKVAAAEAAGARIHAVLPPGHASEAEAQARQRTYNGGVQDRAKIGF